MNIASKIINKGKRLSNDAFFHIYTPDSFINRKFKSAIIMYHGVDSVGSNPFNARHTGVDVFIKQIKYLKKYFNVISLKDYFEGNFGKDKICIAITFDDGYLNNYFFAKPVLEGMKVPATFFITGINETTCDLLWADYINIVSRIYSEKIKIENVEFNNRNGTYFSTISQISLYDYIKKERADFDFKIEVMKSFDKVVEFKSISKYHEYWKLMDDQQIAEIGKSKFIEIGSHGFFHNNLGAIDFSSACKEIILSKNYLENLAQKEVISIGYPDGSYTRDVIDFAEKSGIKYQLAAEGYLFPEDETDDRILDRKGIYSCDSAANQLFNALKK